MILRSIADLRARVRGWNAAGEVVGVVPTMGALHDGHLSLVRAAKSDCARVIVTIFVNPRQFNSAEDLAKYPRSESADTQLLAPLGVDVIFAPAPEEVYPPGFAANVQVTGVAEPLEGAMRPGHFDGVATVVTILFNLASADVAYFGQKDAQQVMVIRRMARDLGVPTAVVACPTVREADGLALSSRNALLTQEARAAAPVVHRALAAAAERYEAGVRSADALRAEMRRVLTSEPLAQPEYVSVASLEPRRELHELVTVDGPALLSMAVRFGEIRLIDNERVGAR